MVMTEALACGTPVVATPCGAAPELVDDGLTGFVCSAERAHETALCKVSELERAACRRAVNDRFSAARLAEDHIDLYTRTLARGDARTARWVPQRRRRSVGMHQGPHADRPERPESSVGAV